MTMDHAIKTATAVIAAIGILAGLYQYLQTEAINAARPHLERQLAWCEEAVETAAAIATAEVPAPKDVARFWQMYWGVMGLIEDRDIERVMEAFGSALDPVMARPEAPAEVREEPVNLKRRALAIARACRQTLARNWSSAWQR